MNETTVKQARQRAFRYKYEDGLVEIAQSGVYVLLGALMWVVDSFKSPSVSKWLGIGVIAFCLLAAIGVMLFIRRAKSRIVYPRTGHVTYKADPQEERRSAVLIIGAALVIAFVSIFLDTWYTSPTAIVGASISLTLIYTSLRTGFRRMQVVALLPLIISLAFAYVDYDVTQASAVSIGVTGLVGLILGLLALRRYLQQNPLPGTQEAQ